jgi:hypothetical protein
VFQSTSSADAGTGYGSGCRAPLPQAHVKVNSPILEGECHGSRKFGITVGLEDRNQVASH